MNYMKQIVCLIPPLMILCGASVWSEPLETDAAPYQYKDTVMVPMRAIFEWIGAEVSFDSSNGMITAKRGEQVVCLKRGDRIANVNYVKVALSTPVECKNGLTFVPLRFVGEAFGASVNWNGPSGTVTIQDGPRTCTLTVARAGVKQKIDAFDFSVCKSFAESSVQAACYYDALKKAEGNTYARITRMQPSSLNTLNDKERQLLRMVASGKNMSRNKPYAFSDLSDSYIKGHGVEICLVDEGFPFSDLPQRTFIKASDIEKDLVEDMVTLTMIDPSKESQKVDPFNYEHIKILAYFAVPVGSIWIVAGDSGAELRRLPGKKLMLVKGTASLASGINGNKIK